MKFLSQETYDSARASKHGREVQDIMKNSIVGVAGLGGLGSNICNMLARMGVGKLIVADFDTVSITNMNRQNYLMKHFSMYKTDATEDILRMIDPYARVEKHTVKITPENVKEVFNGCDIVCEAMDLATEKTMFINEILAQCPAVKIVAGSGMAGYGRSNEIRTEKKLDRLYICGDGVDMEDKDSVMIPSRVMLCAAQMANTVIALLANKDV